MSMDPKEFDMPVESFNPNPMKLGLFTDGLPDMPFEQMLDKACEMGIEVLELGTGGYSCAPHLDMAFRRSTQGIPERNRRPWPENLCPELLGKCHRPG